MNNLNPNLLPKLNSNSISVEMDQTNRTKLMMLPKKRSVEILSVFDLEVRKHASQVKTA